MTFTAEDVLHRLQEAGATLLAMKVPGCWPSGFTSSMPEIVRDFGDMVGVAPGEWRRPRGAVPSSAAISRMEQAFSWLALIPNDRFVIRRIVCARALTCPIHGKPRLSWRKIADKVGASHVAVRSWHAQGVDMIVAALNRPGLCARAGGPVPPIGPMKVALERVQRRVSAGLHETV